MKILTASNKGDRLETLKAIRQKIARCLDNTDSARDIAALTRQLLTVLEQIQDLESATPPETPKTIIQAIQAKHQTENRQRNGRAIIEGLEDYERQLQEGADDEY